MADRLDDLLQPTLTETDDASAFDRPWNPMHLVFVTFFFGLLPGGSLLALNFRRLGQQRRVLPAFLIVVGAAVVFSAAGALWLQPLAGDIDPDRRRLHRVLQRAAALVVAGSVASFQRRRFRLFQFSGEPEGKLLKPAILAIVLGVTGSLVLGGLLGVLL